MKFNQVMSEWCVITFSITEKKDFNFLHRAYPNKGLIRINGLSE